MNPGVILALVAILTAAPAAASPVDTFARRALAEWVVEQEPLPASPLALSRMLSDMPAAVRLGRTVTGVDYEMVPLDTGVFKLTTPRGLIARVRPVRQDLSADSGLFEAVGEGEFHRPNSVFRGRYAMRFRYMKDPSGKARSIGDLYVYIDVENPLLRFFALFFRGVISDRFASEMRRMFAEAKDVMAAAERQVSH